VQVKIGSSGEKKRPTRIVLEAPWPPGFHEVILRPEPAFQRPREIEIGDAPFDREFLIQGPGLLVAALLDEEMRRRLSKANALCRLEIASGELRATLPTEQVTDVLRLLRDIGRRLSRPLDVPRRLAGNAREDSIPGVRLHNLLLLVRELPGEESTAEALAAARSDPSLEVRLRVGKELGDEGGDILWALAKGLQDDAVGAQAVSALGRKLSFERARDLLERALRWRFLRTASACLDAIGRSGAKAAVEVLAERLEQESGELALAAARALGETASPAAEAPLLQALAREDAELQMAAAEALGRVGTAAAVLPLQETAEQSGGDLRRAARRAIEQIQSRLQGASPGQLSLAGAEAGQLSLAQDGGELSLADDPAGRLSLEGGET
jgi:HEAT repeat protein